MLKIDGSAKATLVAALRFYQQKGQGDPFKRSDAIHYLATNGDQEISMDDDGIDDLVKAISAGRWQPCPVPTTKDEWAAVAKERGWSDVVAAHARCSGQPKFPGETIIQLPGDVALHMPCAPFDCDYLRLVDRSVGKAGVELMYWTSEEWGDAPEEVIGAVMGLIKSFQPKLDLEVEDGEPEPLYERTATIDQMALHIASIALGEPVVVPDAAREIVKERFPMETWQYEASNGDTELGYWEWALHAAEDEQQDEQVTQRQRGG
jgi:hypothetical protein